MTNLKSTEPILTPGTVIHFSGIGGIGMSALAEMLLRTGYTVQGSDLGATPITENLTNLGATLFTGHDADNIQNANLLVYSTAIPAANPERLAATHRNVPQIPRAQLLAELMRSKTGIAISGTHGKTSTTSLTALILRSAGLDPSLIVGGLDRHINSNCHVGTGKFFVAEADESDGSLIYLNPDAAIITNIEPEHLDHYKDLQHISDTFRAFLQKLPPDGFAVLWGDDPNIMALIPHISQRVITYGTSTHNTYQIKNIRPNGFSQQFDLFSRKAHMGTIQLNVPGEHMVLNATGAAAACLELGIEYPQVQSALNQFQGVSRRLEIRFRNPHCMIIDDYAHHPTEIAATLKSIAAIWNGPVTAVFQPHRYSRTQHFLNDFPSALKLADNLVLLPVYAASEEPIPGVDSKKIADQCRKEGMSSVVLQPDIESAIQYLIQQGLNDRLIITLGAGNVWKIAEQLENCLQDQN